MCNPIGIASSPEITYPKPSIKPARIMLSVLMNVAFGLSGVQKAKKTEDRTHASKTAPRGPRRRIIEALGGVLELIAPEDRLFVNTHAHDTCATGIRTESANGPLVTEVSKAPITSTQPKPQLDEKIVVISTPPRTIPKSRSSHHPCAETEPEVREGLACRENVRPATRSGRPPTRPATLLASGIAGESETTEPAAGTASNNVTTNVLKRTATSTLKAQYWITNRHSALESRFLSRNGPSSLRLRFAERVNFFVRAFQPVSISARRASRPMRADKRGLA